MDLCSILISCCCCFCCVDDLSNRTRYLFRWNVTWNMWYIHFMLVFQTKHNILMHPFHNLGIAAIFGSSLFIAMDGYLVVSSLLSESISNISLKVGYVFGKNMKHILYSRSSSSWIFRSPYLSICFFK
jgi:hypothetical protein